MKQRHKEKGKGNHAFTYSSFEEFPECALRGTVTDKANVLFHFSFPKHDTVTAHNLYEVHLYIIHSDYDVFSLVLLHVSIYVAVILVIVLFLVSFLRNHLFFNQFSLNVFFMFLLKLTVRVKMWATLEIVISYFKSDFGGICFLWIPLIHFQTDSTQ